MSYSLIRVVVSLLLLFYSSRDFAQQHPGLPGLHHAATPSPTQHRAADGSAAQPSECESYKGDLLLRMRAIMQSLDAKQYDDAKAEVKDVQVRLGSATAKCPGEASYLPSPDGKLFAAIGANLEVLPNWLDTDQPAKLSSVGYIDAADIYRSQRNPDPTWVTLFNDYRNRMQLWRADLTERTRVAVNNKLRPSCDQQNQHTDSYRDNALASFKAGNLFPVAFSTAMERMRDVEDACRNRVWFARYNELLWYYTNISLKKKECRGARDGLIALRQFAKDEQYRSKVTPDDLQQFEQRFSEAEKAYLGVCKD